MNTHKTHDRTSTDFARPIPAAYVHKHIRDLVISHERRDAGEIDNYHCTESYAISYAQRRLLSEWQMQNHLESTIRMLAVRGASMWIDRFARPRNYGGKAWAVEGLAPYSIHRVLVSGMFRRSGQEDNNYPGACPLRRGPRRSCGFHFCPASQYGEMITSTSVRDGMLWSIIEVPSWAVIEDKLAGISPAKREPFETLLNEMFESLPRWIIGGGRVTCDIIDFARAWPIAERATGAMRHNLFVSASDYADAILLTVATTAVMIMKYAEYEQGSDLTEFWAACGFLATLCWKSMDDEREILTVERIDRLIRAVEPERVNMQAPSMALFVFYGAVIHSEADKCSLLFGNTEMRGLSEEEKIERLLSGGRVPLKAALNGSFLDYYYRWGSSGVAVDETASRQNGECLRLVRGLPLFFNKLVDQWLEARGHQNSSFQRRLVGGFHGCDPTETIVRLVGQQVRVKLYLRSSEIGRHAMDYVIIAHVNDANHALHSWTEVDGAVLEGYIRRGNMTFKAKDVAYYDGRVEEGDWAEADRIALVKSLRDEHKQKANATCCQIKTWRTTGAGQSMEVWGSPARSSSSS